MAPPSGASTEQGNPTRQGAGSDSFQAWLAKYGRAEYTLYQREALNPHLTYHDWTSSEHPLGAYLYRLTLDVWDEESSSDDELEESVKPASSERGPTGTVTTNGNGVLQTVDSSMRGAGKGAEELVVLPKKPLRTKKTFLSDATISPEDNADPPESTTDAKEVGVVTSKKRKQKKKFQSASLTPPEEIARSTPVANATNPTVATASPDGLGTSSATRRGLRTRTPAQQRPYFHHAKLFEEQVEVVGQTPSSNKLSPLAHSKLVQASRAISEGVSEDDLNGRIDNFPGQQTPAEKKFKGKGRAWKKDNEDEDDDYQQGSATKKPKKKGRPRKSGALSLPSTEQRDTKVEEGEESELAWTTPTQKEPKAQNQRKPRKSHLSEEFVRESDSDDAQKEETGTDITMVNAVMQSEKPKRKPRRSYLSEEFVRDDSESDEAQPQDEQIKRSVLQLGTPNGSPQKQRRKSRKFHLSEEFVHDESDTDVGDEISERTAVTPAKEPNLKGRQKKTSGACEAQCDDEQPVSSKKKSASRGKAKEAAVPTSDPTGSLREEIGEDPHPQDHQGLSTPSRKGRKRQPGSGSVGR